LGLSNLTIINNTLRIIRKVYGQEIDLSTLPMDDEKTYELLQRGDTTGVFQLESSGMKRYLKELKPTEFSDIVAMCALYRPGPLTAGLTDSFVKRKNGLEKVSYAHEKFKSALDSTFGVLVYQEQVMRISKDVCGFTGGDADTLRKAIGKKKRDVMLKMQKQFIEGGEKFGGVPRAVMEKFWDDLMGFADYAFNKSHSACYGLIAYQTAYLKAHYPAAFMAALMTSDYDDTDRLTIEMNECAHLEIEVLPPDINESFLEFAVVPNKNQIRFGMAAIKNVGVGAVEEILAARAKEPFSSLEDFFTRVSSRSVNRKTIEALIKTGAFDRFGSRSLLLNNIDAMLSFSQKKQRERDSGQVNLFGEASAVETAASEIVLGPEDVQYTEADYLQWERELMGLYLSNHPLKQFETLLAEKAHPLSTITKEHDGKKATVGGIIQAVRVIQTKKGDSMAFVRIADATHELELLLFPSTYEQTAWLWQQDKVVLVEGTVNAKDRDGALTDEVKINVSTAREILAEEAKAYKESGKKIKDLSEAKARAKAKAPEKKSPVAQRIYIRFDSLDDTAHLLALKQHIDQYKGETEVVLVVGPATQKQAIRIPEKTASTDDSLESLAALFGAENVKLS
jgi:DNA polymerase-3 subunit alpha